MATPLYRQIAAEMKEEISRGTWKQDEAVPTEAALASHYDVSRVTVRKALKTLVQEQLLYKIQGSGTYVKANRVEHDIVSLQGFTEEMQALNVPFSNQILSFEKIIPETTVQHILNLSPDEKVFFVKRLRIMKGKPLVVEHTYLPSSLFPDIDRKVMSGSKYDYIEKELGFTIKKSEQEIVPLLPASDIQHLLEIGPGSPVLHLKLFSMLQDDTVFEYTELFFTGEAYKFTITASRKHRG
ncbi:GntR family transcriptional regulator [Alkalicoccus urumqiensis]|uniref:Transcriptional regulator n=1 Tax=Alkalicoccus urumqiensis TaxID=1548213 RepID=A0A2P6MEM6_ALKUR|nr:GntR family transcriptional regulator [Alkalicoccus urumqiensis]PRO64723.1 transcriptional regulator [Alkalicoccus urumqiensis]